MNTRTWLVWLLAALAVAGLTTNPLYLLLVLLAATLVFLVCRIDTPLARAYRLFFLAGLLLWLGYIVFSVITVGGARGRTVLLRLPTLTLPALLGGVTLGGPITAEDLAWGALRGLRLWVLLTIFGSFNALVDHYRLLRLTPRSFFHAGLAVTIAISFVPQILRTTQVIIEAQRVRGHHFRGPRSYLPLVGPLLAGSLERSIQLAEALDARGYGRTRVADVRLSRQQLLLLGGLLLLGAGLFGWLYYGRAATVPALALLAGGGLALLQALRALGQLIPRTAYRRERWRRHDTIVAAAALVCAAAWVGLWLFGAAGLQFNPYPVLAAPEFSPIPGLIIVLLAVPALFGASREDVRVPRRRMRGPARSLTAASARPAAAYEPGVIADHEPR